MRTYLTTLMLVITLGLVSCGGGNETASTGASVTAQATTATVSACNTSASFGGAGPALTNTTNPTLEACNAAITFTCNASITFGGTEPALTATTSPSLKTCIAVMYETNPNNPNGAKVLAGQMTIADTVAACNASGTYGGGGQATGPLLSASTNPTLGACIAAMPGIAYGNPWNPGQNGGCLESVSMAGYVGYPYGIRSSRYGPPLSPWAQLYCYNIASYCCSNSCPNPLGSQQAQNTFCATYNANN